jgi:GNAT superfamily N-acetyltransferase
VQNYKFLVFPSGEYANYLHTFIPGTNIDSATNERRKWWCFDNPCGGAFAVAIMGDAIAATCYISGKYLNLNGSKYKVYEIGETFTSPEHQRRGLFSELVKLCTRYAFEQGATAIYGTPNVVATPGYVRLKFEIVDDDRSHLFLSPNISGLILGTTNVAQKSAEKAGSESPYRISSSQFFDHSRNRERINIFSEDYFKWRFTGLGNDRYAYFLRDGFSLAVREHKVGNRRLLMVADYGFSDRKPSTFHAITEIRKILDEEFDAWRYAGIYFLSDWRASCGRLGYGLRKLMHFRSQPICVMDNDRPQFRIDLRKIGLPQLSDCDMC